MKVLLACVLLSVTFAVSYAGLTCMTDKEKCGPEECCVQLGMIGHCKPLAKEDDVCEMKPAKHLFKDYVYKVKCPCNEAAGLKCESSKGGVVGKFVGKCKLVDTSGEGDGDGNNGGNEDGGDEVVEE
uniref:U12-Hypotoxin-Hsp1a_1 n=1 Tax=Hypochilus sp. SGP-2016 TaxID=1905178 RepID=A0A482ZE27_9ARAC